MVLDPSNVKEYDEYYQQGIVKEMVTRIENTMKNSLTIHSKMLSSKQHNKNINMTDIVSDLLKLQTHLRYDLDEIDWPSMIIGKTTQTSIVSASVNVTDIIFSLKK